METLTLVNQPHPLIATLGRSLAAQTWRADETAREVLVRGGLDPFAEIVIVLNDRVLTVDEWDTVCPMPGDLVHAVAALSGGGSGGSNPLRIVLSIAIMVAAFYVGPLIGAELGGFTSVAEMGAAGAIGNLGLAGATWSAIGSGLVSLAGNLIVGALFKPSTGALSRVNGSGLAASPTYSLSGGSNSMRPYGPMPVVMGTHRMFPDYGAKPFTAFGGDDQFLYQIFNFGLSTLQISDLKIGDSPISNYSDVTLRWSDENGAITGFPGNVDSDAGGDLIRGADWLKRTSAIDTVRLAVDVQGSIYFSNDKGLLNCTVRIEAQYSPVGANAWEPLTVSDVVSYTTGYWSLQTTETAYVGEFPNGSNTVITVQHAYAHSGHSENDLVLISPPGYSPIYAAWHWITFDQATLNGYALPDPQPIYTPVGYVDIDHGATQKPRRTTLSITVAKGVYDVRVRLTSARSVAGEIVDGDTHGSYGYNFSTLRSFQDDPAVYSGQTRLGMVIKASGQISGVVQRLSALVSASCLVRVHFNWRWKPTSNPAWWYLDFARGRKDANGNQLYGCHLDDSQIDIAGIVAWAAFCEAEGLSVNMVIDSVQSAYDTLNDIARCGLASPSWASGKLGMVWDQRNATPVAAFGMSNILRGSFTVRYLTENLADEIVVSYIDSNLDWAQQQIRKTIPGVTNPQRSSTLEIKGCTNARLAGKHANIQAAAQYYRRRQITWDTDVEGFVCQRGDVVILQHDLTQWGYSGRLLNVVSDTLTLDRQVPRSGVMDYVMLVSPDGTMQTWQIGAASGNTDTLVLPSVPTLQAGMLTIDHRWFFSPQPTPGKRVKIVSVKPLSQYRLQLVATDDDPSFYTAWDGAWDPPVKNTLLSNGVPSITAMQVSETLALVGTTMINRVTLSFTVDQAFDSIYVSYRVAYGPWVNELILEGSITFDTEQPGFLEVRSNAFKGVSLGPRFYGTGFIEGKLAAPKNVSGFALAAINGTANLSWAPATDLDVIVGGYLQIRYSPEVVTPDWSSAVDIGGPVSGSSSSTVLPLLAGSYLAKWVDSSGKESSAAATLVTDAASVLALNTVADIVEHPTFSGTKSSVAVVSGSLTLDSSETIAAQTGLITTWPYLSTLGFVSTSGEYWFSSGLDLGSVQTSRVTVVLDVTGYEAYDFIGERMNISTWANVTGELINDVGCAIYLRTTLDDPAGAPSWSDWQQFVVGDYSARAYEFKAILSTGNPTHNILVNALAVKIDMPDRIETGNSIVSGAALCHVSFARPFMVAPAVGITAQDMATGDYYTIANKLEDGFDITFHASGGGAVSRTFDHISKAY